MRRSSRRSKVTWPGAMAGALPGSPPRISPGSVSPSPQGMRRLLAMRRHDRLAGPRPQEAPCRAGTGRPSFAARQSLTNTSVKIIKPPHLRPAHAPEDCEKEGSQGPVRESSGFLSPPAPRGLSGPGPVLHTVQSPNVSGRLSAGLFFIRTTDDGSLRGGRRLLRRLSSVVCRLISAYRGERGAQHDPGSVGGAGLHDHGGGIGALEVSDRYGEGTRDAGPLADLDPAAHHFVVGDRVPAVLAARDRNRDGAAERAQPDFARRLLATGRDGDTDLAVGDDGLDGQRQGRALDRKSTRL